MGWLVALKRPDGAKLAVFTDGEGPDLVLVTGLSGTAGFWEPLVADLAKRYRVSAAQVAQWNKVSVNAVFKPGSNIIVMVPQAAKRSAPAARPKAPANTRRPAAPARPRR